MKWFVVLSALFVSVSSNAIQNFNVSNIVPSKPFKFNEIEGRIVGGRPAYREQFPYQAGISYRRNGAGYWCGGTLINSQWVLTAAHCMYSVQKVTVYLGSNIRESKEPGTLMLDISLFNNSIIVHENYRDMDTSNDIALIHLPYNITFSSYIQPVKLPRRRITYPLFHDDYVVASGWGKDRDNGEVTIQLNYVEFNTMKNYKCAQYYDPGTVKPSNICGDAKDRKGTCGGDSGGPLVSRTAGYLIGITSFGGKTCEKGIPIAFTRVEAYIDWLSLKTGLFLW